MTSENTEVPALGWFIVLDSDNSQLMWKNNLKLVLWWI